jgi:hypothetical protein
MPSSRLPVLPRIGSSKLVSTWLALTIGASIIATLDGGFLYSWASFAPARIFRGELWRLVTWALIETGPMSLVLTCASIYFFGNDLAARWGDRRLRRFVLEIVLGAAVVAAVVALVSARAWHMHRLAGWVVDDLLVIAWARQFPLRVLQVYGLLRLAGRELIALTIAVTVAMAMFSDPFVMALELVACAGVALYPTAWLRR